MLVIVLLLFLLNCLATISSSFKVYSNLNHSSLTTDAFNCIEPGYKEICSNHGQCRNNSCECTNYDYYEYKGKYCEECPYCKGQRCEQIYDCIQCFRLDIKCTRNCHFYYLEAHSKIITANLDKHEKFCEIYVNPSCYLQFKYWYVENDALIIEIGEESCNIGVKILWYCNFLVIIFLVALMLFLNLF